MEVRVHIWFLYKCVKNDMVYKMKANNVDEKFNVFTS